MFYHVFAAIPEWAPAGENHILYSASILKDVTYSEKSVKYTATQKAGTDYLRLSFKPSAITVNGKKVSMLSDKSEEGYTLKEMGNGDFSVTLKRIRAGKVVVSGI